MVDEILLFLKKTETYRRCGAGKSTNVWNRKQKQVPENVYEY